MVLACPIAREILLTSCFKMASLINLTRCGRRETGLSAKVAKCTVVKELELPIGGLPSLESLGAVTHVYLSPRHSVGDDLVVSCSSPLSECAYH